MLNKIIACLLVVGMIFPAYADVGAALSPSSFTHLQEGEKLVGFPNGAWCYNDEANAFLITAPEHSAAKCKLEAELAHVKEKAKYDLEIGLLKVHIEVTDQLHLEITKILKLENENLSKIALDRPTDKRAWFIAGGFVIGVAATILIGWLAVSAQAKL